MMSNTRVMSHGVRLNVVSYGDPAAVPVVLVHGYPDNHAVWQDVAERLAERYFVIAYDVRGAGYSQVPQRRADYRMELLAADLAAVADAMVPGRSFHLAGHDWGSIQCWEAVTRGPLTERILSYTSLSGPCLDHVGFLLRRKAVSRSWQDKAAVLSQLASSWYVLFFHLPVLAPALWRAGLGEWWPRYLQKREQIPQPPLNPTQTGDGRHGVELYRANFLHKLFRPEPRYACCPVQLIVPAQDHYVGSQLFDGLERWVPELRRQEVDAGHWVLLSHPDLVAGWIAGFVAEMEGRAAGARGARRPLKGDSPKVKEDRPKVSPLA